MAAGLCAVLSACASPSARIADSLTASDLALVAKATAKALEDSPVGTASNWNNTESGHLGTVMPTRTFTARTGAPCRDYQQTATVAGRTIFGYDRACRGADGQWHSTRYGSLAQAIVEGDTQEAYARRAYAGYYDDPFCRWPYRDPFCHPRYGYPGTSLGLGFGFGL